MTLYEDKYQVKYILYNSRNCKQPSFVSQPPIVRYSSTSVNGAELIWLKIYISRKSKTTKVHILMKKPAITQKTINRQTCSAPQI